MIFHLHFCRHRQIIQAINNPNQIMQTTDVRPSRLRIVLMWLVMLGVILFWVVFWIWRNHNRPVPETEGEPENVVTYSVITLFIGGFFLVLGAMGYLLAIFTSCLSFNYQHPQWTGVKTKLYFTNIIVTVLLALGFGFIMAAFASPLLMMLGLDVGMARILPVMLMV